MVPVSLEEDASVVREMPVAQTLSPEAAFDRQWAVTVLAHALETLWARLEEVIQPAECDVYSYKGDAEGDPFTVPGSLWSFNFFLYNRKLKRILFFTASAISKRGGGDDDGMGGSGDEEDDDARGAGFFQLDDDDMDL